MCKKWIATKYTYKRRLEERLGITSYTEEDKSNSNSIVGGAYWEPTWAQKNNVINMTYLDCEFNEEFGGILAKIFVTGCINATICWIGQQLDATDKENIFKIGPDCWELFDGKMSRTVEKPISQELFDKAIRLAADELNISIL